MFDRDIWKGQLPTTVEVNPAWFQVDEEDIPPVYELTQALSWTEPGAPRIPDQTATSDRIAAACASIAPLNMIHPLI